MIVSVCLSSAYVFTGFALLAQNTVLDTQIQAKRSNTLKCKLPMKAFALNKIYGKYKMILCCLDFIIHY